MYMRPPTLSGNNTYTNICKVIWHNKFNMIDEINTTLNNNQYYSIKFSNKYNVNEHNKIIYDLQNKINQKI